ncbi:Threonylcarbamoyl-AMP synthase [Halomicronema hongdechloris C2206]|uniref:L-threonylcarbamoyladenylate synthase n=1 Tax=Halomicronema hongdechloris C2206 TaxID=1641165 RepID=A0A1Z3HQ27_9CYAN|nr:Sua5/YciO/YrdC/YwlC family protein [Halomicronema hongdechloris]ASC72420.1 Threonylcarbamoyl-AMP synthase [Halomicronema hongdechloris C2206]
MTGTAAERLIWQRVADRYWPGPLTLVLPASDRMPAAMNPTRSGTLGIRVPDHPLARYLLARTGPLATTSANTSGSAPLTRMAAIAAQFPEALLLSTEAQSSLATNDLGMAANGDGDGAASGQASTVVQWSQGEWVTLRSGVVSLPPDAGQEDAAETSRP